MDNEKKTRTIILKHSIPVPKKGGGEVQVNEIVLNRLKVKHLRNLPESFSAETAGSLTPVQIIPLIAGMADLPESSIDEIDLEDMENLSKELESFLAESLGSGKS